MDGRALDAYLLKGGRATAEEATALLGAGAPPEDVALLFRLTEGLRLHWRATTAWACGTRSCEVLDASERGVWRVLRREEIPLVRVVPTSATEIWQSLIRLLPTDEEIEGEE